MQKYSANIAKFLFVVWTLCLTASNIFAQCPMCKAAAEANLKEGGKHALGLNSGILYLLVVPYLIIATIGIWWWRNYRHEHAETE